MLLNFRNFQKMTWERRRIIIRKPGFRRRRLKNVSTYSANCDRAEREEVISGCPEEAESVPAEDIGSDGAWLQEGVGS